MITVHHLNNSRSQRVLWLLEELGVDYQIKRYERDKQTMLAPPELRAVHPLGKSPVITDNGQTIAESGAIIEYIVEHYGDGRLVPAQGTPERQRYRYWMHYAEGSAMPPLVLRLIFQQMPKAPMPAIARPLVRMVAKTVIDTYVDPQIKLHLDFIECELGDKPWFTGDELSAADIQMSFIAEAAAARSADLKKTHPALANFLARIRARPAYQRAMEKGGPFELAGREGR
jgi:glutathione S-transferase